MKSINFRANFSQRRLERERIIARSGRSPGYAPWLTSQSSAARGCPTGRVSGVSPCGDRVEQQVGPSGSPGEHQPSGEPAEHVPAIRIC